jgi:phenylpyruvate tautomerase PptA (4-oxalocrotonate tautomerase family)
MPIVDVELVAGSEGLPDGLAQSLAHAVGGSLGSAPGETWVRVRVLAPGQYAENDTILEANRLPVFVTVLKRTVPERAALVKEIAALTDAVASITGRDRASVHVEYAPAGVGRVSFGGKLVE